MLPLIDNNYNGNQNEQDFVNEDQMKTVECAKCKESIIEMFLHDHVCKSNCVECNICQFVVMGDANQLTEHMEVHKLEYQHYQQPEPPLIKTDSEVARDLQDELVKEQQE